MGRTGSTPTAGHRSIGSAAGCSCATEAFRSGFVAFDLVAIDGVSTVTQLYSERRAILEAIGFAGPCWATVPRFDDGEALWTVIVDCGLEGVASRSGYATRTRPATGGGGSRRNRRHGRVGSSSGRRSRRCASGVAPGLSDK
jgi:hypothetical protein